MKEELYSLTFVRLCEGGNLSMFYSCSSILFGILLKKKLKGLHEKKIKIKQRAKLKLICI